MEKKSTKSIEEPSNEEIANEIEKEKPATTKGLLDKNPMDYTDDELENMRISKKHQDIYKTVMKIRRKTLRAAKEEAKTKRISGDELDYLYKNKPKEYASVVKEMGKKKKKELTTRINSTTQYPSETIRAWKMVIKAIERGIWYPPSPRRGTWRPPRKMTAYERFMNS